MELNKIYNMDWIEEDMFKLIRNDNMEALKSLPDCSLDAIVTDGPYGLGKEPQAEEVLKSWITTGYHEVKGKGFMGKEWDAFVPQPAFWKEVYRVLKPGGHVLCFFGTRTYDWGVMSMRIAGFEIRDCIQWMYGSGFPKSLDVSKALDKMGESNKEYEMLSKELCEYLKQSRLKKGYSKTQLAEHFKTHPDRINHGGCVSNWEYGYNLPTIEQWEKLKSILELNDEQFVSLIERAILKRIEAAREVVGFRHQGFGPGGNNVYGKYSGDSRITAAATEVAQTWDGYGTALKPAYEPICVARKPIEGTVAENVLKHECGAINLDGCRILTTEPLTGGAGILFSHQRDNTYPQIPLVNTKGRFPSNIILDEDAAQILDEQSGHLTSGKMEGATPRSNRNGFSGGMPAITGRETYGDTGGASRFFYCAKASKADRDYGCEGLELKEGGMKSNTSGQHITRRDGFKSAQIRNNHPTVKPIALMRYLVRLVKTPFDTCTIADPFMGSGTTGVACMLEGVNFIGMEYEVRSFNIAHQRIRKAYEDYKKEIDKPKQSKLF